MGWQSVEMVVLETRGCSVDPTLKAYAMKEGMADSEVATFTYGEITDFRLAM